MNPIVTENVNHKLENMFKRRPKKIIVAVI